MDLSDWIDRQAAFTPSKPALVCAGRTLGYAALARLVECASAALAGCGVQPGDRVAVLGHNGIEQIALLFACARLRAMFAPLSWRLAPPEHRAMLDDCTPRVIVAGAPSLESTASILGASDTPHRIALAGPGAAPAGWSCWDDVTEAAATPLPRAGDDARERPVLLCYTSGTSGQPKGVLLSQEALFYNAVNSQHMHDMGCRDVVLTTLPLFHVGGLNIQTLPALHLGATVHLHPRFDPDATIDALGSGAITLTVLVPAQLEALAAHPRWASCDLSALRTISTGSTIIDAAFVARNLHRGVPLLQVYGSTETAPLAAYQRAGDCAAHPGSIGKAALHAELRLVDDDGRDVPQGATGQIVVRGPNVMQGYWQRPDETAAALRDGWYRSGDLAHADADGFLHVDGRCKDLIISGGENVYPAEIESVLSRCPGVAEVAVVGRRDERWGEAVVAVIVPQPGAELTPESVSALLDGRIARYKHPRVVVLAASLPRTALGKIKRDEIKRLAQRLPA